MPKLLAEPQGLGPAGEEAVGALLQEKPVHGVGADLSAQPLVPLHEGDLQPRRPRRPRRVPGRRKTGDPAADDEELHSCRRPVQEARLARRAVTDLGERLDEQRVVVQGRRPLQADAAARARTAGPRCRRRRGPPRGPRRTRRERTPRPARPWRPAR